MAYDSQRLERRQFMKGAGAAATAVGLAGCTSSLGGSSSGATQMKFVAPGYSGVFSDDIVPKFNEAVSSVDASVQTTTAESSSTREYFVNQFISQSSDFDAGMMDVIWPPEFAQKDWVKPINDPENHADSMLSTPVDAATVDGELVGMPLFTDANAFYYRSDKLEEYGYDEPPSTYSEVIEIAQDIKQRDDEIENGYIWQGGANEGLTIMWLNWLWGMGGGVKKNDELVVNTDLGVKALTHARDLIQKHEVTPDSIPASSTDENRQTFQQGNTLFMRNWPYAVGLMNSDDSPVKDKFDVTTMPKMAGNSDANNSCLGGWNIFINQYTEKPEAAQRFASWMASKPAQNRLAANNYLPVREDVYTEENFEKSPLLELFSDITKQTNARPLTSKYTTFSSNLFKEANKALIGDKTPQQALDDAQSQIDSEVNNA